MKNEITIYFFKETKRLAIDLYLKQNKVKLYFNIQKRIKKL